ncbi:MAG: alginate lyase family protein [Candidatus Competibacteraceae bacterium]
MRYFHTLRHLRPVQFYGRLWFRLYRPRPDSRPAPPLRPVVGPWISPPAGEPCLLGPATFRFLDQTRTLAAPGDWNRPDWDKLWLYNLHYFDDLNAAGAAERRDWQRALIARWIADNPPGHGNGWEPYPLSLRIVNWIQWARAGNPLEPAWLHSLAIQVRYLARRLERHLLGNHLFANAKALVHAGLFFAGPEAERWLIAGLRVLDRQLPEQILPDGGHFERSPMYHAIILDDILDLLNLAASAAPSSAGGRREPSSAPPWLRRGGARRRGGSLPVADWRRVAQTMPGWLRAMTHPDGGIAFFNDAAFGIAPTLAELADYAGRLGVPFAFGLAPLTPPLTRLPDSGYLRLQAGPAVLILDVGPVGPDYLPGHAHADTLSFELSLFGQRIAVNSGTSCYGTSPERQRQRGTAAHNAVTVDGQDSSEVWGGFRVARRARPLNLRWGETADGFWVECAHDGYQRLPGRVTHWRRWTLSPTSLRVEDRLDGCCGEAIARLHLHPAIRAGLGGAANGWLELPDGRRSCWNVENSGGARLTPSTWHPRFGVSAANVCLEIPCAGPEIQLLIQW